MAERPEDLNLPNAVITRIIKDAIPDGVNVSKEARLAISKAASVFVLYATSCSNNFAMKGKRKTIGAQDVLAALEDMEFDQFVEPLNECLQAYRKDQQGKKDQKKKEKEKEAANLSKPDEMEEEESVAVTTDHVSMTTDHVTNGDTEIVEISDTSED